MPGIGTIVNVIAVIAGGILGILFGKKIKLEIRDSLMKVAGVAVIFIGISGALTGLLKISEKSEVSTSLCTDTRMLRPEMNLEMVQI